MKKLLVLGALLAATPAMSADLLYSNQPRQAHAFVPSDFYVAAHGGVTDTNDFSGVGSDTGYNFSAAFGREFGQLGFFDLRGEVEVGYFNADLDLPAGFNGNVDSTYAFANVYADFNTGLPFTPFIGGGVGYAKVNAEVSGFFGTIQGNDNDFAYNVTAGLSYALTKDITFDVAYKYITVQDVEFATPFGAVNDDLNTQQINAGVRVKL